MDAEDQARRAAQARARRLAAEDPRTAESVDDAVEAPPDAAIDQPGPNWAQWTSAGIFAAVGVAMLGAQALYGSGLEQTAAMFVGLPMLLGILLSLAGRPGSALGIAMRGVTLFLLLSAIVLHEGVICVLMAAPLFYGIAALVGLIAHAARRRDAPVLALWIVPIVPLAFEGTVWEMPRAQSVEVVSHVRAPPAAVARSVAAPPVFDRPLPLYLRMGFPRPVAASGQGLAVGDRRTIHFAGGEGHPGDLVLEVVHHEANQVVFARVSDDSHIDHWLSWDRATVQWRPDGEGTEVTWRLDWTRRLDPGWWFAPWEAYGMDRAATYLVQTVATP